MGGEHGDRLSVWLQCDRGRLRSSNEDSTLALQYVLSNEGRLQNGWLLAVADGMGGEEAGEVASRVALTTLAASVLTGSGEHARNPSNESASSLVLGFREANRAVFEAGVKVGRRMGTTLVAALLSEGDLVVGNVGDSRCYGLTARQIRRVTRDDSAVQELLERGQITEEEARTHPRRNEITNALGIYPPDVFTPTVFSLGRLAAYDFLLLSSDGLHGVLGDAQIADTVYQAPSVQAATSELLRRANSEGGPDNISVVLARVISGR